MKTEKEVRAMTDKLMAFHDDLPFWDDGKEFSACMIDALLWVLGDESGRSIDPDDWKDEDEEEDL